MKESWRLDCPVEFQAEHVKRYSRFFWRNVQSRAGDGVSHGAGHSMHASMTFNRSVSLRVARRLTHRLITISNIIPPTQLDNLDQHLNLRQIIIRIALENHAWPFDVNFT